MAKKNQQELALSELIYNIAREAPLSLKRGLPMRLFRAISSEKMAMKFACESSYEEKREFLSYMGVKHFVVFANVDKITGGDFKEILKDFSEDKLVAATKKIANLNIFVSSDKQYVELLGMTAQSISSPRYSLNMELLRTGYHIQKWHREIKNQEHKKLQQETEFDREFCRLIFNTLMAYRMCESWFGVTQDEMRLLLLLKIKTFAYISSEDLVGKFTGTMTPNQVAKAKRSLLKALLIEKHYEPKKQEYTISARGILITNQFRDKVINSPSV